MLGGNNVGIQLAFSDGWVALRIQGGMAQGRSDGNQSTLGYLPST